MTGAAGGQDEGEWSGVQLRMRLVLVERRIDARRRDGGRDGDRLAERDVAGKRVVRGPGPGRARDTVRAIRGRRRREVERVALPRRVDRDGDAAEWITGVSVRHRPADRAEVGRQGDGQGDRNRDLGLLRCIRDEDDEGVVLAGREIGGAERERDDLAPAAGDDAAVRRLAQPRCVAERFDRAVAAVRGPIRGAGQADDHGGVDEAVIAAEGFERHVERDRVVDDRRRHDRDELERRGVPDRDERIAAVGLEEIGKVLHPDVLPGLSEERLGGQAGRRILVGVEVDIATDLVHRRRRGEVDRHRRDR